jgi:hypothetical protein
MHMMTKRLLTRKSLKIKKNNLYFSVLKNASIMNMMQKGN